MNKVELISAVSKRLELTKKEAEDVLRAFTDIVTDELADGEKVAITGFGTFEVVERSAREARNPKTGESITVAASKAPKFRAGKNLKDAVKEI